MAKERVERRLAAILAADVAGYSRLMGQDEEGTMRALKAHRRELTDPKIAEHHGRIANTAGDSLLVEFASVVDALRCAVDVQAAMRERNASAPEDRRIVFRMGINVGDVMVQGTDLLGDGVNVAARLEQIAEPGGVYISRAVREQVGERLPLAYEDLGPQQVKNIARPVEAFRVRWKGYQPAALPGRAAGAVKAGWSARSLRRLALGAAALALVAVAGAAAWKLWQDRVAESLGDRPSIAVLPFDNLSGDKQQDYFSDGITEDVAAGLGRFPGLRVIASHSSFRFRSREDVPNVGKELGARYVLRGSVRRGGDLLRIAARLGDTRTGTEVWAERYDRPVSELFAIQDELTRDIVSRVASRLEQSETRRAATKPTSSLDAYELNLVGRKYLATFGRDDHERARQAFERAIGLDPAYAESYAGLARVLFVDYIQKWGPEQGAGALDRSMAMSEKAIALDPTLSKGYSALAEAALFKRQHDVALAAMQKALALNPSDSETLGSFGNLLVFVGEARNAVRVFEQTVELDPFYDPALLAWQGRAYYILRDYDKAIELLRRGQQRAPNYRLFPTMLAVCFVETDRLEAARSAVADLQRLVPGLTGKEVANFVPFKRSSDVDRFLAALRKAGLPE